MLEGHEGLQFEDPTEMLLFVDDALRRGEIELHPWQIQCHKDFAKDSTSDSPYQAVLRTCNGAGKDRVIIAPCATWLASRFPYTICVITSASGTQLDRQTNAYIKQICEATNAKFGQEIWRINYRHYENLVTKSTIEMFVTDESGRAEGWHPMVPGGHLAIFTSEAKSIPEEIFHALARCTGFTKRLDCSTPGLPMGHFFNRVTGPPQEQGGWKKYHITAYECPHLSKQYIEQCRTDYGGESSALFKSMVLAEFGTTDEMVVIPYYRIFNAINNTKVPHFKEPHNTGGLDLSAGGDETTLAIRNGNKLLNIFGWRIEDTSKTIDHLETLFSSHGLKHEDALIYADVGGLGNPILWELKSKRGWRNIRFVDNRQSPRNKRAYYNRGTELWFDFNGLLEGGEIILLEDKRLRDQLSTRYYKMREDGTYILESKIQARAKGHPSPDRGDAVILCYSNYKTRLEDPLLTDDQLPIPKLKEPEQPYSDFRLKDHAKRASETKDIFAGYYPDGKQRTTTETRDYLRQQLKEWNDTKRTKQLKTTTTS